MVKVFTTDTLSGTYTDQVVKAFPAISRMNSPEAQAVFDYLAITDVPHICEKTLKPKVDALLAAENITLAQLIQ